MNEKDETKKNPYTVERLAEIFHAIYQKEAERQKDKRYPDSYDNLYEKRKEYGRVLARYILASIEATKKKNPFPEDIWIGITEEGMRGKAARISWNQCMERLEEILLEGEIE